MMRAESSNKQITFALRKKTLNPQGELLKSIEKIERQNSEIY